MSPPYQLDTTSNDVDTDLSKSDQSANDETTLVMKEVSILESADMAVKELNMAAELASKGMQPVTKRELWGFYVYSAASEPYSVVLMSVFLPIILETLASKNGYKVDDLSVPCDTSIEDYKCVVKIGNTWVNTSSFPLYVSSFAVIIQAFLFVSLGALADHGNWRKTFLLFFNVLGAVVGMLMLTITTPKAFLGAAPSQALTGNEAEITKVSTKTSNTISGNGMAIGYAAGVTMLILSAIIVYFYSDPSYAMHIGGALTCLWWAIAGLIGHRLLPPRPSPPLPAGENYFTYSWKKVFHTVKQVRKLSHTFRFLLAWFMLSDGVGTITSVAVIFAKTKLGMTQVQLIIAAIIVPISAAVGVYFWLFIQRRFNLTTKTMLIMICAIYTLMPIYGLLGFFAPFGLKHQAEIWVMSIASGLLLGAVQSYARVMFADLLPPGRENEFFSLYEITDKGAAWIGPLVTAAIADATEELRYAFCLLIVMLLMPVFLTWFVDVKQAKKDASALSEDAELEQMT
ncbi:autophagy-related protein 22-like protein [Syncephalis plumigaleata]|nr:autophagy-related protein 22-like protein [Syncephalis plumigaleata]